MEHVERVEHVEHAEHVEQAEHMDDGEELKPAVAFLGPFSSYSHQAALQAFSPDEWDIEPVVTIKDIFDVVQAGHASYGVVPFENSTNGPVVFTLDALADRAGQYADLTVCGEIYLDVHHFLVGFRAPLAGAARLSLGGPGGGSGPPHPHHPNHHAAAAAAGSSGSPFAAVLDDFSPEVSGTCTPTAQQPEPPRARTRPLTSLRHLQRIYSHPQAWGQCAAFLSTYLRGVETIDVSSTSKAAELVRLDAEDLRAAGGAPPNGLGADGPGERPGNEEAATSSGDGGGDGKTTTAKSSGGKSAPSHQQQPQQQQQPHHHPHSPFNHPPHYTSSTAAVVTSAAIASELAAELHGFDVLARCIEDREDNTTRFFVLRRMDDGGAAPVPPSAGRDAGSEANGAVGNVSAAAADDDDADARQPEPQRWAGDHYQNATRQNGDGPAAVASVGRLATETSTLPEQAASDAGRTAAHAADTVQPSQAAPVPSSADAPATTSLEPEPAAHAAAAPSSSSSASTQTDAPPPSAPLPLPTSTSTATATTTAPAPASSPPAGTKTLVSFTVPHRAPGALAAVLDCFRRADLNLTSINSRPSLAVPFTYVFFVEFDGSRLADPRGTVAAALADVAAVADDWRWLGSWDAAKHR